ncbi:insulinase family protein [bacterium]|nr:insulinase family protein [bacterium]
MENITITQIKYPFLSEPLEIYQRECGHTIIFAKKKGELINVSTWVKTGSINENDLNSGISHFLEHMMFKGTKTRKPGEFDKILESKGALTNAATSKDSTFYYVTIPKGSSDKNFDLTLSLHADMMLNAAIPPEEAGDIFNLKEPVKSEKRERHVVIEEIRMRMDQPWTKTYNLLNHNLYNEHPYKRDVIGTAEIISQMKRDTIYDYYLRYYTANNMTTIVVGDFDSKTTLEKLLKLFDFEGRKNCPEVEYKIDEQIQTTRYREIYSDVNTGFIMYGYVTPKASKLKESIIFEILSIVMGEGLSSRFYQNLIEKQEEQIFNVIGADYYQYKDGGNFFVEGNFKPEEKEKAIELIDSEIDKLLKDGITENELGKAVKKLEARFAGNAETVSDISETIGYYATTCESLELAGQYLSTLQNITLSDVKEMANAYLTKNHSAIAVLMPEKYNKQEV